MISVFSLQNGTSSLSLYFKLNFIAFIDMDMIMLTKFKSYIFGYW